MWYLWYSFCAIRPAHNAVWLVSGLDERTVVYGLALGRKYSQNLMGSMIEVGHVTVLAGQGFERESVSAIRSGVARADVSAVSFVDPRAGQHATCGPVVRTRDGKSPPRRYGSSTLGRNASVAKLFEDLRGLDLRPEALLQFCKCPLAEIWRGLWFCSTAFGL